MADEQDLPDSKPDDPSGDEPAPQPPAKKAPAKAAKKAPAKKAPAKKAPAKAIKKAAPAKKAPAKKAPPPPPAPPAAPALAQTNGSGAAKEAAAHAKSTVANGAPVLVPQPGPPRSNLPMAAAIAAGVLAILVVLLARRISDDD